MTNPNDPAFSQPILGEKENGSPYVYTLGGLTKREEFAKAAMQGILAGNTMEEISRFCGPEEMTDEWVARKARVAADALIAELSK